MILLCKSESYIWLFVIPWTIAARLSYPRNSPGKNTGVGCHALLQGIFPTQGLNLGLPHCGQILYHLSHSNSGCQMLQQQPSLPLTPEGPTRSPGSHGPSGRAACTTAWTCGRVFSCSGSHQNSQLFNPWIGRIPWRRERYPLQYSDLESSRDWTIHGIAKSWIWLSGFHFLSDHSVNRP